MPGYLKPLPTPHLSSTEIPSQLQALMYDFGLIKCMKYILEAQDPGVSMSFIGCSLNILGQTV